MSEAYAWTADLAMVIVLWALIFLVVVAVILLLGILVKELTGWWRK